MGLYSFFQAASNPKQALSKTIASALGEYFDMDSTTIETNLLSETHVRLETMNIKRQVFRVPSHTSVVAEVTGYVHLVEFAWNWSLTKPTDEYLPNDAWVKDSRLNIRGLHVQIKLIPDDQWEGESVPRPSSKKKQPSDDTINAPNKKEQKGLQGYVLRQVQIIVDSLALDITDFDLTIVLPNEEVKKIVRVGGKRMDLRSFGRHSSETDKDATNQVLEQNLELSSFFASVVTKSKENDEHTIDLFEPFTYAIHITRTGGRFSGYSNGVHCAGSPKDNGQLIVHVEQSQINALTELGALLLAPPGDHIKEPSIQNDGTDSEEADTETSETDNPMGQEVSLFEFNLTSMTLTLLDGSRILCLGSLLTYKADGTQMDATLGKVSYTGAHSEESKDRMQATLSKVGIFMRPNHVMSIESIDAVHVPGIATLREPIVDCRVSYVGSSLDVLMKAPQIQLLESEKGSEEVQGDEMKAGFGSMLPVPVPTRVVLSGSSVVTATDGSSSTFGDLQVFMSPDAETSNTQIAIELAEFKNELLILTGATVFAELPLDVPDTVQSLKVSTDLVKVTAGKSTKEWKNKFEPKKELKPTYKTVLNLPKCQVASTKLTVSWAGTGVSLKDTSITTKSFQGNDKTTSEDVIIFVTRTCLKHVPGFISNAEVFGVNIVEFTTSLGFQGLAGSGAGLAAVVAVDSVKGAFNAGKKSRGKDDGSGFRPDDLFRGIVHASVSTANYNAKQRGKEKGNFLDFASGVTKATGGYVGKNKSRLGAAGAGGAGAVIGTVFGGPLGGLAGGLIASKMTKTTIDHVDDKINKEEDTASSLKSF